MPSDKISRLTGFAFVLVERALFFPDFLASEGKREVGAEFPLSFVCVCVWKRGGYGYFLKLLDVILFKNKVNRKQPKTHKPQGGLPYERGGEDTRRKF